MSEEKGRAALELPRLSDHQGRGSILKGATVSFSQDSTRATLSLSFSLAVMYTACTGRGYKMIRLIKNNICHLNKIGKCYRPRAKYSGTAVGTHEIIQIETIIWPDISLYVKCRSSFTAYKYLILVSPQPLLLCTVWTVDLCTRT